MSDLENQDVSMLPIKDKNIYKIIVKGKDPLGFEFLENVVELSGKGAVIDKSHSLRMSFPHQCVMILKTSNTLKTDMSKGIEVIPIRLSYTEQDLQDMDFDELRKICKQDFNIIGKERKVMIERYLSAVEESNKE